MKGKQWTVEAEKQLKKMVDAESSLREISLQLGKSPEAVRAKLNRLGLVVNKQHSAESCLSTSNVVLPKELISAEDTLKMLVGALRLACTSGLSKLEVQRLQVVANLARTYSEKLVEYMDWRGLEKRLFELEVKYDELAKRAKGGSSTQ